MKHSVRDEGGTAVVAFDGDVDLDQSPAARKVLLECVGQGRNVVVDMSRVAYIDSSGIASLVEALQSARRKGTTFALAAVSESARRVLELARLDKVFVIHRTVADGTTGNG
jgi:anti-sigma B factor antagonist